MNCKLLLRTLFIVIGGCGAGCLPEEQIIPVEINISLNVKDRNHTSPLYVSIENHSEYAREFHWRFEGGVPSVFTGKHPPVVRFDTPGKHAIVLEAANDASRLSKTLYIQVDSAVTTGFNWKPVINCYAPAEVKFTNFSTGGTTYEWIFEGGEPAKFTGKHPPDITFPQAGVHMVSLRIDNGSKIFTISDKITVMPELAGTFGIYPSWEDEDYEAPLTAELIADLQGTETISWDCSGARLANPACEKTEIFFHLPGNYQVNMHIGNGKQIRTVSQNITIRQNHNLRIHRNVCFGINTASEIIGCCYSTKRRKIFTQTEISYTSGKEIDLVFLGLNKNFSLNKFISPDSCILYPLLPIQDASHTVFYKEVGNKITPETFLEMEDDYLLENTIWEPISHPVCTKGDIVLFHTADKRKGVILVKEMVDAGILNSHIITDIKIQKND